MSDNARIQSSNAQKFNKNIKKEKLKLTPMYTQTEVEQVLANFQVKEFGEEFQWQEFSIKFKKAGHILGASSPIIANSEKKVQFSGDLGRQDDLVTLPPAEAEKVDCLVIESTYGNRLHLEENLSEKLKKIFSQAKKKQSAIIIPAFSVGRSQTLMKILIDFFKNNPELNIPVFVDSPMTQSVTELYFKYLNEHKISERMLNIIKSTFHFVQYKSEKERLDKMDTAHIILTAGGMMSGGNILHHLAVKGEEKNNYIFIVGFQSPETIGYELLNGNMTHTLENKSTNIEAQIIQLKTLSSHADHDGLISWSKNSEAKRIFITHGEEEAKNILKKDLEASSQAEVIIPHQGENYQV